MSRAEVFSPIPEGYGLLHIGPHKTGSTAIQDALHQARREMLEQGVRYASASRHDAPGARWVTGRLLPGQEADRAQRRWASVVAAMRDESSPRRVFSSEFLSDATDEKIDLITAQLGADATYVVVTLRPIAKILPSQYQQSVHRGFPLPYEAWLQQVFHDPDSSRSRQFWLRQRHDELIRRWGERVGLDRTIAVVVDSSDFSMAPRTFEQLLALMPGTLAEKSVMSNRSYTLAELELVRAFHEEGRRAGLSPERRHRLILRTSRYVKARVPAKGEPKLATPAWAVEQANAVGAQIAQRLGELGVRVIGDTAQLSTVGVDPAPASLEAGIDPALVGRFAVGMGLAVSRDEPKTAEDQETSAPAEPAAEPRRRWWRR